MNDIGYIKFIDLKPKGRVINDIISDFDRVYNSGNYIGNKEVVSFENEWAEYCGSKYCVGTGNGHDALVLASRYFYDEYSPTKPCVSVPWKTCLPTWAAVKNGQCSPVPESIVSDVKVAVHIYGDIVLPDNFEPSNLIEDCAQAHGAKKNNVKAGGFGRIAAWSFYPTKNLGALGDAGAITTNDENIALYINDMRDYGSRQYPGINSRLDSFQAAVLSSKLKYLDSWNAKRRENASVYLQTIIKNPKIDLPKSDVNESCWHIFSIEVDDRDNLKNWLREHGVETMIHYPYLPYPPNWHIPLAELWVKRQLSLPVAPHVNERQCKYIGNLINEWMDA